MRISERKARARISSRRWPPRPQLVLTISKNWLAKKCERARPVGYHAAVKLLLIDGHYYVYRSFFAIPSLSNSRGEPTNAIFGFTKTLRLMVKHLQPDLGAVFWDEGMPERRVKLQPAYKETRKEMPKPMVPQLDFIQ